MVKETKVKAYDQLVKFQKDLPKKSQDKWVFRGEGENDALKTSLEKAFENFGIRDKEHKHKCNSEKDIIREFQRKLHLYTSNLPDRADIIQWLAIMQHYGAPTRLLDWSYSFWVAVYFAIAQRKPKEKAIVWAVNTKPILEYLKKIGKGAKPNEFKQILNRIKKQRDLLYCDEDAIFDNAYVHFLLKARKPKSMVYASSSFRLNQRLTIQQGTFLIAGDITKSFQKNLFNPKIYPNDGSHVQKCIIVVSPESKLKIINKLREMNINDAVLFPDLDGFSQSLWTRVGLPFKDKLSIQEKKLVLYP
jgi:hypothetical protein